MLNLRYFFVFNRISNSNNINIEKVLKENVQYKIVKQISSTLYILVIASNFLYIYYAKT